MLLHFSVPSSFLSSLWRLGRGARRCRGGRAPGLSGPSWRREWLRKRRPFRQWVPCAPHRPITVGVGVSRPGGRGRGAPGGARGEGERRLEATRWGSRLGELRARGEGGRGSGGLCLVVKGLGCPPNFSVVPRFHTVQLVGPAADPQLQLLGPDSWAQCRECVRPWERTPVFSGCPPSRGTRRWGRDSGTVRNWQEGPRGGGWRLEKPDRSGIARG